MTESQLPKVGTSVAIRFGVGRTVSSRNTQMPVGRGEIDSTQFTVTYGAGGVGSVRVCFEDSSIVNEEDKNILYVIDLEDFVHNAYHAHCMLVSGHKVRKKYDPANSNNSLSVEDKNSRSFAI